MAMSEVKKTKRPLDTILVVDDNPQNLQLLNRMLQRHGYKVLMKNGAREALESLNQQIPDLFLLDVMMPEMDGLELCQCLKADKRTVNIPVIFISALSDVFDKVKAFAVGGVDYITKPFEIDEILVRIDTHLQISHLRDTLEQQNEQLQQRIIAHETAELELTIAKEQAESANRAKSVFLANMSHELKTPLNGILGYAQILAQDDNLLLPQKQGIEIIQRSGEQLLSIINDVLEISKMETGKSKLKLYEVELQSVLNELVSRFKQQAIDKGLTFIYEQVPAANSGLFPISIQSDEKYLRQVLYNLLSNAVKFTQLGSIYFRVHYQANHLQFEVEDTGCGISESLLSHIFQPFQLQQKGQRIYSEGSGLGLAIAQRIVQMMNSQIRVESQIEKGSRFYFEIKVQSTEPILSNVSQTEIVWQNVSGYQFFPAQSKFVSRALRILVVDDVYENRLFPTELLTPLGFAVTSASGCDEALTLFVNCKPDVVIMDLRMPFKNGAECIQQMQRCSHYRDAYVLVSSATGCEQELQEALNLGCHGVLEKPLQIPVLLKMLGARFKLKWLFNTETQTIAPTVQEFILPNTEQLQTLIRLAQLGDVKNVSETCYQIIRNTPNCQTFCQHILNLVNNFEMIKLKNFLKSQYDKTKENA